jgi:hypothetical protein
MVTEIIDHIEDSDGEFRDQRMVYNTLSTGQYEYLDGARVFFIGLTQGNPRNLISMLELQVTVAELNNIPL